MSHPSDFRSAATAGADVPSDDDVDMCLDHDAVADEDGFVHVTRPLMTVRQFTDWVRAVQLPDADAVMQGRLSDDTIQALVSRRTFLRDLLASFDKKKPTDHAEAPRASAAAEVLVEEAAWPRLWSQFIRDLPREGLSVDGSVLSPAPDAASAQALAVDPGAYAAEVVLPCIRRFIAERLPPDARGAVESNPGPATPSPAPAPGSGRGGIVGGLAWVLGLAPGAQSVPADEPTPPSYRASTSVSRLPVPPSVPQEGDESFAVLVEGYARLVVLMAQQAVLALPLEILSAQFCVNPDARLFVGEVARSDPRQRTAGMRVTLDPTPGARHGAVLRVAKTFRVFSLADGDDTDGGRRGAHAGPPDYTLFYVSVAIELDLLAAAASTPARPTDEDHVSLSWRVEAATPAAVSSAAAVRQSAAPASFTTTPTTASPPAEGAPRRVCECLGASAGYHQPTCHVNWQAVA